MKAVPTARRSAGRHRGLALALAGVLITSAHAGDASTDTNELDRAREELQAARDELARAARELARVARDHELKNAKAYAYEFVTNPDRAMLGVTISHGPQRKDRRYGVLVTGVTPGSGADKAGLHSGDLLLSANGTSLIVAAKEEPEPKERLSAVMDELKPGDIIAIEYERDAKVHKTEVRATRPQEAFAANTLCGWQEAGDVLLPPLPPQPPLPVQSAPDLLIQARMPSSGLQLVRLDDDLAAYFDTHDGVLVVHAPQAGTLELKSGDVIQSIDGREVSSPVAAWEALSGAGGDKPVRMRVMRRGESLALEGSVPESELARKALSIMRDEP